MMAAFPLYHTRFFGVEPSLTAPEPTGAHVLVLDVTPLYRTSARGGTFEDACSHRFKWQPVAALGSHVAWHPQGLDILLPPRDVPWAEYGKAAPGNNTSTCNSPTDVDPSGPLPVLQIALSFFTSKQWSIRLHRMQPVGAIGLLGWLGVPSMLITGALVDVYTTDATAFLEIVATVKDPEGSIEGGKYNDFGISNASASHIDEHLQFFGRWSDANDQQGTSPPPLYGAATADIPLSRLAFPRYSGLLQSLRATVQGDQNSDDASVQRRFWRSAMEEAAFGATGMGLFNAFVGVDGFPSRLQDIEERYNSMLSLLLHSDVTLIIGGCAAKRTEVFQYFSCDL